MTELVESGKIAKMNTLHPMISARWPCGASVKAYAEKFVKLQTGQMKRLLTLADYDHPYLTMQPELRGGDARGASPTLIEQGLVYRALKPVHWSIANQTALAEAELEYEDREDLSVYVDFEAVDADAVYDAFGLAKESSTTPRRRRTREHGE